MANKQANAGETLMVWLLSNHKHNIGLNLKKAEEDLLRGTKSRKCAAPAKGFCQ